MENDYEENVEMYEFWESKRIYGDEQVAKTEGTNEISMCPLSKKLEKETQMSKKSRIISLCMIEFYSFIIFYLGLKFYEIQII